MGEWKVKKRASRTGSLEGRARPWRLSVPRFLDVWHPGSTLCKTEEQQAQSWGLDAWNRAPAAPPCCTSGPPGARSYSPRDGSQGQVDFLDRSWPCGPSGLAVLSWHQQNRSSRPISVPTWSLGLEQESPGWVGSGWRREGVEHRKETRWQVLGPETGPPLGCARAADP